MRTVVVAGGGTGGHLFPGLAVATELRRGGVEVAWLGARRGLEATRIPAEGIPLKLLAVTGAVARSPAARVIAALSLAPAVLQAARYLLLRRTGAVLAVGGYASLPGALAAAMLGIPLVLQEQNALPGVANWFLAPWAVAIACGFPEAVAEFPSLPAAWTGNPVRTEFFAIARPPISPLSVLVMGGSQGSAFLNQVMPHAFAELAHLGPMPRIIHQAGTRWEGEVRHRYADAGVAAVVVGFLERPAEALAGAALVVARAGALTVCELAAAGRAALLVPFAAAAHGHQARNARAYAATGAALVFEEAAATPPALAAALALLLADPARLVSRGEAGTSLARPGAATAVARLLLERAGGTGGGLHP